MASIVDYLKSQGQDSSYANRSQLASQNGISNYKGTAAQNIQLYNTLKNQGSSSPTSNTSGSTTQPSGLNNAYIDAVTAQRDAYQKQLEDARRKQQEAANAAYNSNKSNLESAYSTKTNALKSNLDNTLNSLQGTYNNSVNSANADAAKSLQEAYINRMLSQKNLQQNLSAQGLSGGASESSLASLLNNYGNSRNNIETTNANNLTSLADTYNNNVASANSQYNTSNADAYQNYMNYLSQIESDRANALSNSYADQYSAYANLSSDYVNALLDLQKQQYEAEQNLAKTNATNSDGGNININQHTSSANGNNAFVAPQASQLYAQAARWRSDGLNDSQITTNLVNAGLNNSSIASILKQLDAQWK